MILLRVEDERQKTEPGVDELMKIMQPVAAAVWKNEGIDRPAVVDVMLVEPEEIRRINAEYRQVDSVTDVLSFPMLGYNIHKASQKRLRLDTEPDTGRLLLGDLVFCIDRCREQGEEYGHGFARELGYLTAHGILHLLGFDHGEDEPSRREMRQREETALAECGLMRQVQE